ncbi:hypothetical protein BHE74_00053706, partial [Ensete ventricosum]
DESSKLLEEKLQNETFIRDSIPSWFAASGYIGLAAITTATIPSIFPQMKWYLVLACYIFAPALAFCNSYGTGLTDWSLASTYGKIGLFIFASLVGSKGGVIAGLAACGVMMSIVSTAADLMQDFKTGYLTLSSPRSMFVSQLIGTALGCIIAPLTFWLYWTAFDIGSPDGVYKAPYAVIYREMAILGVEGFSALPKHCLELCSVFFVAALIINLLRDVTPKNVSRFIPIPMAMAVPFYIGAYFAIDMFIGTVILFVWERLNRKEMEDYAGAVASGLICGDGIWTVPSAILAIFRIDPPICITSDIRVEQRTTGASVEGQPEYQVTVSNTCDCPQSKVMLLCYGLNSVTDVDPRAIKPVDAKLCAVAGGRPLSKGTPVKFKYAWKTPQDFPVVSSEIHC